MKLQYCLFILLLIAPIVWSSEVVLINQAFSNKDKRSEYAKDLLQQVFIKTEDEYPKIILQYTVIMNEERAKLLMYKENYGDVINAATRKSWEHDLIAVKIPILKGIMGMRILLIKKEKQKQFSKISTLSELKEMTLGSGHIWAITPIFKNFGFLVITGSQYEGLFKMLVKERFDYFPRGVNEIIEEYQQHKTELPSLHIEESILLKLSLPVYFFVNPTKPELAKRIETGLKRMIEDGSFDDTFNKHFIKSLKELNISNRKVFVIDNKN